MTKHHRPLTRTALLIAIVVGAFALGRLHARADGAPTTTPLAVEGTLTDASGRPYAGETTWALTQTVFDSATSTTPIAMCGPVLTTVVDGRFTSPLEPACVAAFRNTRDTWVELAASRDGTTVRTSRSKVYAAPYALEADRAVAAVHAQLADRAADVVGGSSLETRIRTQAGASMALALCALDEHRLPIAR